MSKSREDFYKRLRELSDVKAVNENKVVTKTLIDYERSNDGIAYGIVKENHEYIIKKSLTEGESLHAADFVYIDGVQNKGRYSYNKLSEAEKQRNLHIMSLNEAFDLGGVYNKKNGGEAPSLETSESVNSFLHNVIKAGKSNIKESKETKFKATLKENNDASQKSSGLMPEAALNAVQKALGKVNEAAGEGVPFTQDDKNEGDIVTADSEIKDGEKVSEKKGKEAPQAPINDSNAKAEADKATATGTKDFNKKDGDPNSLAVNQADKKLTEGEDLSTADSEINASESPANKQGGKESAQAPINDENAKSVADSNDASGGSSEAISNNVEESPESDPFDDKENANDVPNALVTADSNITEGATIDASKSEPFEDKAKDESGDEVTADSDHSDGDRVDNETKSEATQAPYGAEKQPEKGHKEEKGKKLEADATANGIWEGEDLSTKDSHIKDADKVANKTEAPNTDAESQIVKDSELNPNDSVANDTKTNLPNPVYEGDDLSTADSEIVAGDSPVNKTQTNLPNPVAEDEEVDMDAIAEGIDDLIGDKVDDLDAATEKEKEEEVPAEEPVDVPVDEPEMGGEEMPDMEGGEEGGDDLGLDMPELDGEEGGEEMPMDGEEAPEGEEGDKVKEIEKNLGKANQIASSPDVELDADKTQELINSVLGSFKDHIAKLPPEDKETTAKKITAAGEGGEEMPSEEPEGMPDESGLDAEANDAIDSEIANLENESDNPFEGSDLTFESFVQECGYENLSECSVSEAANVISRFASNGGQDYEAVAPFINRDVKAELSEYGHVDYLEQVQPFIDKLDETDFSSYHGLEPMAEDVFEDDEEDAGEEPADIDVPAEVDAEMGVDAEEVPAEVDAEIEAGAEEVPAEEPVAVPAEEPAPEPMGFAGADTMAAGVVKPESAEMKSVEIDVKSGTVNVNMSESEKKFRNYVQQRLQEMTGKKKPSINESEKSEKLKKLDKMIEEQFNLYAETVKKKS